MFRGGWRSGGSGELAEAKGPQHIIPVVFGRAETANLRVEEDHPAGHGVAGGISIETTVDGKASREE